MKNKISIKSELARLHKKWGKKDNSVKNILDCADDIVTAAKNLMQLLPKEMQKVQEVDDAIQVMVTNVVSKKRL